MLRRTMILSALALIASTSPAWAPPTNRAGLEGHKGITEDNKQKQGGGDLAEQWPQKGNDKGVFGNGGGSPGNHSKGNCCNGSGKDL